MSTKIPKRLEEMIDKKAEEYPETYMSEISRKDSTDLTLAVLSEAEKLVEALEIEMGNSGTRQAEEALSNWKKFVGEEK